MLKKIAQHSWPFSAILFWLGLWLLYYLIIAFNVSSVVAMVLTLSIASILAKKVSNRWRQWILIGGFIASWFLSTPFFVVEAMPSWVWLLPLLVLLFSYPVQTWADAPFFPTPENALTGLSSKAPLDPGARIVDAGCGMGHALWELKKEYPLANVTGIERSTLLARIAAWRCKWTTIEQADIWKVNWSAYDMVYVFQRPESMQRTQEKAMSEMKAGSWLVSLEFEMTDCVATDKISISHGKIVWLYQMPLQLKQSGDSNV